MTTLELIERDTTHGNTQWIKGRSPFFLSFREDGVELWKSNRPYGVNDRLYKFPAGYTPTLEDIDEVLYEEGI